MLEKLGAATLALASLLSPLAEADAAPTVRIADGVLAGASDGKVERFLAIPFAAPPTGPLRWRAPQPVQRWTGVRDATRLGPACPQTVRPALVAGGVADNQSEDCLQLNIWRPARARKLPVMVWIHGGAHVIGSGTFPAFDGRALAAQGVILVSVNYRLGALGYFAHPALTAEAPAGEALGNYGLMDQLAALRWVKSNIAAFGGDPDTVTLFGESAGAIAVTTLLANAEAKGLFARAIAQSSVPLAEFPPISAQEKAGAALATRAGAGPAASAADLRALPAAALVRAGDIKAGGSVVGPMLDGRLIAESPWRSFARGETIDVPLLVGANSNEASVIFAMGVPPAAAMTYLGPRVDAGRATYGSGLAEEELARQILGDAWFVAPSRWLAERASQGAPSYLYHFDYVAATRRQASKGAAHGSEIPYLFGTLDYFAELAGPVDEADRRFGRAVSACWVAFAKQGHPGCPLVPGWKRYQAASDRWAVLGPSPALVPNFRKAQIDHLLGAFFSQARTPD